MTKQKRFSLNHMPIYGLSIVDNKDGGYCRPENEQDLENLCQILNELYDENEQLKSNLKHELTVSKSLRDIVKEQDKENERLKKRLSDLQKENYGNIDGIAFYQEENAMLKNTIARNEAYIERMQHKGEWRK